VSKPILAIDLGSNTLRLLAYECQSQRILYHSEQMVKTAEGLRATGRISPQAQSRIIATLQEAQRQQSWDSYHICAVTTEAMRRASNASEVLAAIETETGVVFEVISGAREASLTLLAVQYRLRQLASSLDSFMVVDIGGGSTELIFCYPQETISRSFAVGIVTMAERYPSLVSMERAIPHEMAMLEQFVQQTLASSGAVGGVVATAGTPTTLASLKQGQSYATYEADVVNGTVLSRAEVEYYHTLLLASDTATRAKMVGTGRAELISAGCVIFQAIYAMLGVESVVVIDDGLREGVVREACGD